MTKIIETPTLETDRFILKPVRIKDAPTLQIHFNNWNIIKNLLDTVPWPYPNDGTEDYLKSKVMPQIKKGETFVWTLNLKENPDTAIGLIEYRHITDRDDNRGFWLAESYWKKGFMTEAVSAVNDYVFDILGQDKMTLQNYSDNIGSHRVKEKTGALLIKTEATQWRGENRMNEIWELTAENWKKFKDSGRLT
jgi:RimJ/RimL family protein N-acetyltransferase